MGSDLPDPITSWEGLVEGYALKIENWLDR